MVKSGEGEVIGDEVTTNSISNFEVINKLEEALTKIQDKKIKTVEAISRIEIATARLEMDRGETGEAEDNITSWLEATTPDNLDKIFGEEIGINEDN